MLFIINIKIENLVVEKCIHLLALDFIQSAM